MWLHSGQDMGKKNNAVLVHPDVTNVTMKTARDEFGFSSFVVFEDLLHLNASRIEDKLQGLYQKWILANDCGVAEAKAPNLYTKDKEGVHKVFVTFSFEVQKSLRNNKLKLQKDLPKKKKIPKMKKKSLK